ncbi:MAG: crotonase/enoyl-CoA hydratase family protein [Candidatus Andeanibacterium colombiense]|uniref:Crotonase/enoyl-CoA hydratase family protein n=1 Tax=Candidatus Andeanibacterium colombiense TaxID=3121345 RepID=A0AAJ6BPX3_9SPHN|nr:MAG: crotonase/enoyl-CoA hydratase family protein [Sphingomonadaceae bacterium]
MDRLASNLDRSGSVSDDADKPVMLLGDGDEHLVDAGARHLAMPEELFHLKELECFYEDSRRTLWSYMRPAGRPSFNPAMLADFNSWQRLIGANFGPGGVPLRFLVLGSRSPGVWCFGGDLELFQSMIRARDHYGLVQYGYKCVEILHRNMQALDLPMLTIGLVEGAALGGGFEALLSFDHIIAERGATFGLPEMLFGLFPGMGAHSILTRKLGSAMAERLIVSNQTYTAEQMFDLGIVHQLAEPGEGLATCREFIDRSERRHGGLVNARKAMKQVYPITLDELKRVVDLWADAALQLREQDLKIMSRLASAQSRLASAGPQAA